MIYGDLISIFYRFSKHRLWTSCKLLICWEWNKFHVCIRWAIHRHRKHIPNFFLLCLRRSSKGISNCQILPRRSTELLHHKFLDNRVHLSCKGVIHLWKLRQFKQASYLWYLFRGQFLVYCQHFFSFLSWNDLHSYCRLCTCLFGQ
jgi:hypothetical protein